MLRVLVALDFAVHVLMTVEVRVLWSPLSLRLTQLVQSAILTSWKSGVRIPDRRLLKILTAKFL